MAERDEGELRRSLGISRRALIRRGAIVGGTLVWTIPVLNSISQAKKKGSPLFFCCWCQKKKPPKDGPKGTCLGPPFSNLDTAKQCKDACDATGGTASHFTSGPNPIPCDDDKGCGKTKT